MGDDEEYEVESGVEYETVAAPSIRWTWIVFVMRFVEIMRNVLQAVVGGLDQVVDDMAHHYNYEHDQRSFADAARAEIEQITSPVVAHSEEPAD